ncbi:MAG: 2-hydroxychromene-2-carboxylate isomerase [Burkholderiaceae bacterium]|nr:2-hydroxychromene-2-carboxylate isomerase [Burkholderiaceae bacterium]
MQKAMGGGTVCRLEFFFFIGSTYSYLSVSRASELATRSGAELVWRPFSVRTLMREQNNVPFAGKPSKTRYMWRDLERRAMRFGVPFRGAPPYPIDADELANRVATLAADEGWCEQFTRAAYAAWFEAHRDPGQSQVLYEIVSALGRDPQACVARANEEPVRASYARATDRARELGIFGSPTFVAADGEIFWGDDRLEDAIDWTRCHATKG